MESINLPGMIAFFQAFGPIGLVALIWYIDMRALRRMHADHKDQVTKILAGYKEDMAETRRMYESNVRLVESYDSLAKDLKDVVVLNTRQMTKLSEEIVQNQYCPVMRVEKRTIKVES